MTVIFNQHFEDFLFHYLLTIFGIAVKSAVSQTIDSLHGNVSSLNKFFMEESS
jgi:hypothetical protein